jgi:hypothetical protein
LLAKQVKEKFNVNKKDKKIICIVESIKMLSRLYSSLRWREEYTDLKGRK